MKKSVIEFGVYDCVLCVCCFMLLFILDLYEEFCDLLEKVIDFDLINVDVYVFFVNVYLVEYWIGYNFLFDLV